MAALISLDLIKFDFYAFALIITVNAFLSLFYLCQGGLLSFVVGKGFW
jgi:hypothetical protein